MTPDEQARIDHLNTRNRWLEAQYRRACEELDWKDEKIRVLTRIIERLGNQPPDPSGGSHA